jgi:alkylation response protein AidB-like acyl-CoA dehydrogenase
MYNLHLSSAQLEFRDTVRDFIAQEVEPIALKPERLEPFKRALLTAILDKASQMGLRTMASSEDNDGAGTDNLTGCIVTEELAVGDADIVVVLTETSRFATTAHSKSVHFGGRLSRRQGCRGAIRCDGRDARNAAAKVH